MARIPLPETPLEGEFREIADRANLNLTRPLTSGQLALGGAVRRIGGLLGMASERLDEEEAKNHLLKLDNELRRDAAAQIAFENSFDNQDNPKDWVENWNQLKAQRRESFEEIDWGRHKSLANRALEQFYGREDINVITRSNTRRAQLIKFDFEQEVSELAVSSPNGLEEAKNLIDSRNVLSSEEAAELKSTLSKNIGIGHIKNAIAAAESADQLEGIEDDVRKKVTDINLRDDLLIEIGRRKNAIQRDNTMADVRQQRNYEVLSQSIADGKDVNIQNVVALGTSKDPKVRSRGVNEIQGEMLKDIQESFDVQFAKEDFDRDDPDKIKEYIRVRNEIEGLMNKIKDPGIFTVISPFVVIDEEKLDELWAKVKRVTRGTTRAARLHLFSLYNNLFILQSEDRVEHITSDDPNPFGGPGIRRKIHDLEFEQRVRIGNELIERARFTRIDDQIFAYESAMRDLRKYFDNLREEGKEPTPSEVTDFVNNDILKKHLEDEIKNTFRSRINGIDLRSTP